MHPVFSAWHAFAALPDREFAAGARRITKEIGELKTAHPAVAEAFRKAPASMADVAGRYGRLLSSELPEETRKRLVEGALFSSLDWLSNLFYPNGGPERKRPEHLIDELFVDNDRKELGKLKKRIKELEFSHHGAPPRGMVLVDAPEPVAARVFIRGNPKNLGEEVPRWFLSVVARGERRPFRRGSGRLELARAIASKDNPLTARVMVNRIWMHHFGEGLVRTPSDFGVRSDPPSHPDLLDWLARRFVGSGWSIKAMHRLILRSAVYRQSGAGDPRGEQVDPQNRLLWRMNARRLDLEAMRDSLLAVAGRLDRRVGGRSENLVRTRRRTLYGYLNRQELLSIYRTFDFAIPDTHSPRRPLTTVPQQALFLMNSGFVMEQAKRLAGRADVVREASVEARIRKLYRICYGRAPTDRERELSRPFLGKAPSPEQWAQFAQVLLESNEFVFVD